MNLVYFSAGFEPCNKLSTAPEFSITFNKFLEFLFQSFQEFLAWWKEAGFAFVNVLLWNQLGNHNKSGISYLEIGLENNYEWEHIGSCLSAHVMGYIIIIIITHCFKHLSCYILLQYCYFVKKV